MGMARASRIPLGGSVNLRGFCEFCGATEHSEAQYKQGRSGRPYRRAVALLRREGSHICWICGVDIDMRLPDNDKWSWTLDHVLALAEYPCLALDRDNHREAHRTCNSAKGKGAPKQTRCRNSRDW